ncbi:hypothetical protein Y032_0043g784 [Ancylostoma ceylanicum]|uniref:Uncharacterized protein n=1 Tax=Ancylostoma ceylanicum TaxID=53326 RepID=A0A016UFA0_9BILA|nr:hypothetical protein Y032_0043g784 [Ancylostoma ceylanicum]
MRSDLVCMTDYSAVHHVQMRLKWSEVSTTTCYKREGWAPLGHLLTMPSSTRERRRRRSRSRHRSKRSRRKSRSRSSLKSILKNKHDSSCMCPCRREEVDPDHSAYSG